MSKIKEVLNDPESVLVFDIDRGFGSYGMGGIQPFWRNG